MVDNNWKRGISRQIDFVGLLYEVRARNISNGNNSNKATFRNKAIFVYVSSPRKDE